MAADRRDDMVLTRLVVGILDALHERDPAITEAVIRSIESYRDVNEDEVVQAALNIATLRKKSG